MSLSERYAARFIALNAGDRAGLRQAVGRGLDDDLAGFDLFTGMWWPLRQTSPKAPERRSAWLVAKLHAALPLPHVRAGPAALPRVLGRVQPRDARSCARFRRRFDALLLSPLGRMEPHLRWALSAVADAIRSGREQGLDWVQLLDDLRYWDAGVERPRAWAKQYLDNANEGR